MKYLMCIIVLGFVYRCDMYGTERSIRSIPNSRLTKKESRFVDSLNNIGISNVSMSRPMAGIVAYGTNAQTISFSSKKDLKDYGIDSLSTFSRNLAVLCYSNVLEDSVIYDCEEIIVKVGFFDKGKNTRRFYFSKDSLEQWTGIKVIKDHNKHFVRK